MDMWIPREQSIPHIMLYPTLGISRTTTSCNSWLVIEVNNADHQSFHIQTSLYTPEGSNLSPSELNFLLDNYHLGSASSSISLHSQSSVWISWSICTQPWFYWTLISSSFSKLDAVTMSNSSPSPPLPSWSWAFIVYSMWRKSVT